MCCEDATIRFLLPHLLATPLDLIFFSVLLLTLDMQTLLNGFSAGFPPNTGNLLPSHTVTFNFQFSPDVNVVQTYEVNNYWNSVGFSLYFNQARGAGDPHIQTLDHEHFDLSRSGIFNLFSDRLMSVNGRVVEAFHNFWLFNEVGLSVFRPSEHLKFRAFINDYHQPVFWLNGEEITQGSAGYRWRLEEFPQELIASAQMGRYLNSRLVVQTGSAIVQIEGGSLSHLAGFFNINVIPRQGEPENTKVQRSVSRPGLFQIEHFVSLENDGSKIVRDDLLDQFVVDDIFFASN